MTNMLRTWFHCCILVSCLLCLGPATGMKDAGTSSQGGQEGSSEVKSVSSSPVRGGEEETSGQGGEMAEEEQEYDPRMIQGANPCPNSKPTEQDHAACQGLCNDTWGISAPQYGGGPWTIGKCKKKKKKCKCKFNYSGFKRWLKTLDKVKTRGDPKKLGNLVLKRYNKKAASGQIIRDENDPMLK